MRKIITQPWFKSKIVKDRAGLDDESSMFYNKKDENNPSFNNTLIYDNLYTQYEELMITQISLSGDL